MLDHRLRRPAGDVESGLSRRIGQGLRNG